MFTYSEIIRGNVFNRGDIRDIKKESNLYLDYNGKEVVDSFHSIFMHTAEYADFYNDCFEWFMKYGTI